MIFAEVDSQTKEMLKLIGEDGDSFAQRAEIYFERRPQLIEMVEELQKSYCVLAERYDRLRSESAKFHHDQMLKNSIKIDDSDGLNTAKSTKNSNASSSAESMLEDPEFKENELSVRCTKVERNLNGNVSKACDYKIKDISRVHSSKSENGAYLYNSKKEVDDLVHEEIKICTHSPKVERGSNTDDSKGYEPKTERNRSTYGLNGENGDSDNDPKGETGDSACDVKRDAVKLTNNLECENRAQENEEIEKRMQYWKEERESDLDALSLNECDVKRNSNSSEYGSKRYNGDYAYLKERESYPELKVGDSKGEGHDSTYATYASKRENGDFTCDVKREGGDYNLERQSQTPQLKFEHCAHDLKREVANNLKRESAYSTHDMYNAECSAARFEPVDLSLKNDTWVEMRNQLSWMMKENMRQQRELIKKNAEKRETIKQLQLDLIKLNEENNALQHNLMISQPVPSENRVHLWRWRSLSVNKLFGR
ncbi:hypothetical protein AMTR_s00016p00157750 [Amborella trichopoda]|uniref:NAB domain-containing protein n=2 Tax=Amborella trichopoda TaxID=13333 RepID=W1PGJ7_AMBTC|nr:hypothetical protein AMTR_s00016p00157750 [Amborella trichopoda]